jgi:hypothetical protein
VAQKPAKGGEKAGVKDAVAAKTASVKSVLPEAAKAAPTVAGKKPEKKSEKQAEAAPVKRPSLSAPRLKKPSGVPPKTGVVRRKVEPLDVLEHDAPPKAGPNYIDPATDRIAEDAPPLPKPMTTFNL